MAMLPVPPHGNGRPFGHGYPMRPSRPEMEAPPGMRPLSPMGMPLPPVNLVAMPQGMRLPPGGSSETSLSPRRGCYIG